MEVITKNKMLDMLARSEMGLAQKRFDEGSVEIARLLFADSARKYEYIASTREKEGDCIRTLEHARRLAVKAEDHKRIYGITSKIVRLEMFPERELRMAELKGNEVELSDTPLMCGIPKVTGIHSPEMSYYKYIIDMRNGNFERLVEAAADSYLEKTLVNLKMEQVKIEDGTTEKTEITLNYALPLEFIGLSSKHRRENSEYVKNMINVLGNSLELLLK